MYRLSKRSRNNLLGVKVNLVDVVETAITLTDTDFGVIEGVRTIDRQTELVNSGASQTLRSKHLTGDAVDLMAYLGSRASWELNLYDNIAEAMRESAIINDVSIRWGGCWIINDIRDWEGPMQEAMNYYIDTRRSQGRRPFIDAPHFELS